MSVMCCHLVRMGETANARIILTVVPESDWRIPGRHLLADHSEERPIVPQPKQAVLETIGSTELVQEERW